MVTERLAEIWIPEQGNLFLCLLFYALAGASAILLHRWGQVRYRKKQSEPLHFFDRKELRLPETVFYWLFFLLTGALKPIPGPEGFVNDKRKARQLFFAGLRFNFYGAAASFLLYTTVQFWLSAAGSPVAFVLLLLPEALLRANLSAMWFSLLPLPGFDEGMVLASLLPERQRIGFCSAKAAAFFLFTALSVFLARAGILFWITRFPIILITT